MQYQDEWLKKEAADELDELYHRSPEAEYLFYRAVATGDVESVRENCQLGKFLELDGVGILSRNPVTNLKYHFVVTAAMITRICWQNGMELERTYRLSDFYIQKLDDAHTMDDVRRIHDDMVLDFAEKMRRLLSKPNSKHIRACKEYIYAHIKELITVEDLAEALGVSTSYLSRLFKKETGESISAYIRARKIAVAENLLKFTDHSMIEIANLLSFSSESHFIQQFREVVGITPKKYRDENFLIQWDGGLK